MKQYTTFLAGSGTALALLLGSCAKEEAPAAPATSAPLAVEIENVVGTAPLVLDTRTYTTAAGESFTVTDFSYYLSNFILHKADGSEYAVPESYFLVREERPGSTRPDGKRILLQDIPLGDYTGLSFLVGVDEEHNSSGAQTGALDPVHGMFWDWNQGYVFLKMEGSSPQSGDATSRLLSYHVGGFRPPNTIRIVAPPLPAGALIKVKSGGAPGVHLRANLLRLFEGQYPVRFGSNFATVGGPAASQMATNYSGSAARSVPGTNSMFTVMQVRE